MKHTCMLMLVIGTTLAVRAQELSAIDLLSMSSLPPQKFEQAINKKGFIRADMSYKVDTISWSYLQKMKDPSGPRRSAQKYLDGPDQVLLFSTSSQDESIRIREKLKQDGFFSANEAVVTDGQSVLYQKDNMSVTSLRMAERGDTSYNFRVCYRILPLPSRLNFAEDLLQFNSHEQLASVFGNKNVLKDVYYFSDNEVSPCTVLFPLTSRQAVFIWKDELNQTELSSIMVGGGLRVGDDMNQVAQVSENNWVLRTGVRPNMKLKELLELNEKDFEVYGKRSPFFMKAFSKEKGAIDFDATTVILSCLNCGGNAALNATSVSAQALADLNMSMHVMMVILSK